MASQPLLKGGKMTDSSSSDPLSPTSAPTPGYEYEVFLSFRGPDTRKQFTDHLYNSLKDAGVRVFRDDEELRKGEEIGPELLQAIKQSKIAIPIFSRGYASSKWCLKELAQIVECRKTTKQMILPIFYDVTPNQVRHQTAESYSEAFSQHMKKYDEQMIQQWKDALSEAGALKGWDLYAMNGYEGQLIKSVVKEVLSKLKKAHLVFTDKLIGIEDHVKKVMRLLAIGVEDVRAVGLWGMGGIGKTTLAKFIYNQIVHDFDSCCFLNDVRETSLLSDLKSLQSLLVANLSRYEHQEFASTDEGINVLRSRFCEKKVLVLLDDIDQIEQLDKLVVELDAYGPGSRFIITTRNRDVLRGRKVNLIYEVKEMDKDRAFQLFRSHAFGSGPPPPELGDIAEDVCKTTGGFPLALEVVGSYLSNKTKDKWEATLEKLKQVPHSAVLDKLKISYDALDYGQKQIFLDIACLFIGEDKNMACYMWKDCNFFPEDGLDVLARMSLIKIMEHDRIWMHDQLRDLGREIARENCKHDPRKWSRLWDNEAAIQVLEDHTGSSTAEAIRLHLGDRWDQLVHIKGQFENLPELRYLELQRVDLAGDFQNRLSNLRWLRCYHSSFSASAPNRHLILRWFRSSHSSSLNFAANLHLKNLVVLELQNTDTILDWKNWSSVKMMKLKVLDLTDNRNLKRIPDLSAFPNLEVLIFKRCSRLEVVDPSVWKLQHLSLLDMSVCQSIKALPTHQPECTFQVDKLPALKTLDLHQCGGLKRLPNLSIFKFLKKLDVGLCPELEELEGLDQLVALEELCISICFPVEKFPSLKNLKLLRKLIVYRCFNLSKLEGLDQLVALEELDIHGCQRIERLPSLKDLKQLKKLCAFDCKKLQELQGLDQLIALEELDIQGCRTIEQLPSLNNLHMLKKLNVRGCQKLQELHGLDQLIGLEELDMTIERLSSLKNLKLLKKLNVRGCQKLQELHGLDQLIGLEELDIRHCKTIERLPSLKNLHMLKKLNVRGCQKLQELHGLDQLVELEELDIRDCKTIERLPNLKNLKLLKKLNANGCEKLQELQALDQLVALEELHIDGCKKIKNLPSLKWCY